MYTDLLHIVKTLIRQLGGLRQCNSSCASWKYRLFTDMTWLQALWIQAKGVMLGLIKVESL